MQTGAEMPGRDKSIGACRCLANKGSAIDRTGTQARPHLFLYGIGQIAQQGMDKNKKALDGLWRRGGVEARILKRRADQQSPVLSGHQIFKAQIDDSLENLLGETQEQNLSADRPRLNLKAQ